MPLALTSAPVGLTLKHRAKGFNPRTDAWFESPTVKQAIEGAWTLPWAFDAGDRALLLE